MDEANHEPGRISPLVPQTNGGHGVEVEPTGFFAFKNAVLVGVVMYATYLIASHRGLPNVLVIMRAAPGDVLFRIVDHRVVWALVDIAERDLAGIAIGQTVDVRPRAFPDRVFSGKVALIYPHLNAQTRTARIRIELANPEGLLRAEMYVDATIDTGDPQPVLAIPTNAVLDSGTRQAVLVDKGQGRFEPREVKLGRRGEGYVEVREGLADGEPVVTSANFLIDAESNLKAALKGFSEAGAQP